MARLVLHLVHANSDGRWHLKDGERVLASFDTKAEALEEGKKRGSESQKSGRDAQLMVHREDGSFETEHTYGHDPRRTPG